jgi:hypothetical protein
MPDSVLPSGFSGAKTVSVGTPIPNSNAFKHHGVGQIEIEVRGPDPNDLISMGVFPTAADALADFHDGAPPTGWRIVGTVPNLRPSVMVVGSTRTLNALGRTVSYGVTDASAVVGNVMVQAETTSSRNASRGNPTSAVALLHAAINYVLGTESNVASHLATLSRGGTRTTLYPSAFLEQSTTCPPTKAATTAVGGVKIVTCVRHVNYDPAPSCDDAPRIPTSVARSAAISFVTGSFSVAVWTIGRSASKAQTAYAYAHPRLFGYVRGKPHIWQHIRFAVKNDQLVTLDVLYSKKTSVLYANYAFCT